MARTDRRQDRALDAALIYSLMPPKSRMKLSEINVLETIDSTNSALQRLSSEQQHAHAILAEHQTSGRGRRSRQWFSPARCNIYLSLGWRLVRPDDLSYVPLLVAVCVCRALSRAGLKGHGIKWPNDVLVNGRKLAGILVEMQATAGGPATAVIGLGVNVNMPAGSEQHEQASASIDRLWTDLSSQLDQPDPVSRNSLAALLLEELVEGATSFEKSGFASVRDEWDSLDMLSGREVVIEHQSEDARGIARGIDASGGLVLERAGPDGNLIHQTFHAGEIKVLYA